MLMAKGFKQYVRLTGLIVTTILILSPNIFGKEEITTKTLDVLGTGIVKNNNVSKARNKAISNSLESAVGQAALNIIPHTLLVEKFHDISETIFENTDQYIENYKVMAELVLEKRYKVIVQATVSIDKLKQRLKQIGMSAPEKFFPKILFIVSEKNCANSHPEYWWRKNSNSFESQSESLLSGIMKKKGFPIVDHTTLPEGYGPFSYNEYPSHQDALTLGVMFNADLVITGKATVDKTLNLLGEDVKSFQSTIFLKAIRTDSGKQIAEITKTAVSVNPDIDKGCSDALIKACQYAGEDLSHKIQFAWEKGANGNDGIEIFVEGTDNLANFVMFRRQLRNVPGANNIQILKIRSDSASILVKFDGDAKALGEALMLKTFANFGIKIYDISDNYLKIGLIPENSF